MIGARLVILTGAGLSAESGLGTFRDANGLWSQYDLEDVATPGGFARDPGLVHGFYNARRANCRAAAPNGAHEALAGLQRDFPQDVALVTQNIDDLLERAGAPDVIHMHGELFKARCAKCAHVWPLQGDLSTADACPSCGRAGYARPDVVWFGEIPYFMEEIYALLKGCEAFCAIGTSGAVYPAAGFAEIARGAGARTLEINLEDTEISRVFHERRRGPATQAVPVWAKEARRLLTGR